MVPVGVVGVGEWQQAPWLADNLEAPVKPTGPGVHVSGSGYRISENKSPKCWPVSAVVCFVAPSRHMKFNLL